MDSMIVLCILLGVSSTQAFVGDRPQIIFPGFPALKEKVKALTASLDGLLPTVSRSNIENLYKIRQDNVDAASYDANAFVEDKTALTQPIGRDNEKFHRCSLEGKQKIDISRVQAYNNLKKCYDSRYDAVVVIEPLIQVGNQLLLSLDNTMIKCSYVSPTCVFVEIPKAMDSVKDYEMRVNKSKKSLEKTLNTEEEIVRCFQHSLSIHLEGLRNVETEIQNCLSS